MMPTLFLNIFNSQHSSILPLFYHFMCLWKSRHQGLIESIYPNVPGQSQLNQSNLSYFLYYLQTRPHKLNKSVLYLYLLTCRYIYQKSDSFHLITLKIINGIIEQNKQHLNLFIMHLYKIVRELLKVCIDLQQSTFNMPDGTLPALDNPLLPSLTNSFILINAAYDGSLNIDEEFALIQKEIIELLAKNIMNSDTPTAHSISYYALLGIQSVMNAPWIVNNRLGEDLLNFIIPRTLTVLVQLNSNKPATFDLSTQLDPLSQLVVSMMTQFISKLSTSHVDKLSLPLFLFLHPVASKPADYPWIIQFLLLLLARNATYQVRTILLSTVIDHYKQACTLKQYETCSQLLFILNQWFLLPSNQHVAIPMLELVQSVCFVVEGLELQKDKTVDPLSPGYLLLPLLIETISTLLVNPYHAMYIHSTLKWTLGRHSALFLINFTIRNGVSPLQFILTKLSKYSLFYLTDTALQSDVPLPRQVLCPELFVALLQFSNLEIISFFSQLLQMQWHAHLPTEAMELRHGLHLVIKKVICEALGCKEGITPETLIAIRHCFIGLLQYQKRYEHRHECVQMMSMLIELQTVGLGKKHESQLKQSLMALQVTLLAIFYGICDQLELMDLRHLIVQVFITDLETK